MNKLNHVSWKDAYRLRIVALKGKNSEYTTEMNKMKCSIKRKSAAIKQLEEELEGINNFQSQSEHQFIKAFTSRILKVNPEYKTNRPKLLRDIRILRQFFGGKIAQETTNDPEQLRITIAKCKRQLPSVNVRCKMKLGM